MTGRALSDHLALLARSGLMTHVAELEPPVTAESMEQFRADAAAQASNVMALSSGTFAVCLAPSARTLASRVPHRLRPIEEAAEELGLFDAAPPAGAAAAAGSERSNPAAAAVPTPAPRRILPPSLRRNTSDLDRAQGAASTGTATRSDEPPRQPDAAQIAPGAAPHPLAPGQAPSRTSALEWEPAAGVDAPPPRRPSTDVVPTASQEPAPMAAIAEVLDRLTQRLDAMERRLDTPPPVDDAALHALEGRLAARLDAQIAPLGTRVADAMATGVSHLAEQIARAQAEGDAAAQAREGRTRAQIDGLGARVGDALTTAEDGRAARRQALKDAVQGLALAQAEQEAHTSEGFATLRLGLRAMNDRLTDMAARISSLPANQALPEPDGAPGAAPVTYLHPEPSGAADPSVSQAEDAREVRLRAALGALLDELGQSASDPGSGVAVARPFLSASGSARIEPR